MRRFDFVGSIGSWATLLGGLVAFSCGGRPEGMRPNTLAPAEGELAQQAVPDTRPELPTGQLPTTVVPTGYAIKLDVDPTEEKFRGEVEIGVRVSEPLRWAWIHGNKLEVSASSIEIDGRTIDARYEQLDDQGVASLHFSELVPAGEGKLRFTYEAPFNRALRGLYRVDEGGASYAFTQFEATSARLAFPCFDEPAFKTPFDMTMTVPADQVAAFNTPTAEETVEGDHKTIRFATSKPMPTYLVAMAVGPFDVVEHEAIAPTDVRDRPVPLRGLASRGKGERLRHALTHTGRLLQELEEYFGIPYPYAKLDIVAVSDFGAGAMENVGLITFRETLLLLDDNPPDWQLRAYAYVMAHELAHQWFGNLVTMPWWDDIWLNEAFATWMGNKAVDGVFPEYNARLSRLTRAQSAMGTDSLVSARQIRQPIESNHDIRNAFDSITYSKGGGVLTMFEHWIGEEKFRDGIRAYLRAHEFGTATYSDFLSALTGAAGRDVTTPFQTFLFQPGVPFVDVQVECSEERNRIRLSQSRYFPVGSPGLSQSSGAVNSDGAPSAATDPGATGSIWGIPVCVRTDQNERQCTLLDSAEGEIALEACPQWVMPNAAGAGYYRFNMEADQLTKLRERGWSELTVPEQMALADSIQAAFANASMTVEQALQALEPMAQSELRHVASVPMDLIRFLMNRVLDESEQTVARRYAGRLYAPAWRRLGWQGRGNEDGEARMRRSELVSFLGLVVKDARVRREAVRRAHRYLGYRGRPSEEYSVNASALEPNLVGTCLVIAVQDGDEAFRTYLTERFLASEDARHRSELLAALSASEDESAAAQVRSMSLDARVRVNEMMTPLYTQMSNRSNRAATWAWVKEHFGDLAQRLETGSGRVAGLANNFCSAEEAADVQEYFGSWIDSVPGGPRTLANALERIKLCGARVQAHAEAAHQRF